MARFRQKETFLDNFRRISPASWLLIFSAAAPWLRVGWESFVVYPGHWLLSCLLAAALAGDGFPRHGARFPLKTGLLLGLYVCLMAVWRQQWGLLAVAGTAVALNYPWALAAYRLGRAPAGAGVAGDGLILLLGASLFAGLAGWGTATFWPPLCPFLPCPPAGTPYVFQGGWADSAQYLLAIMLLLPVAGGALILLNRDRRLRGTRNLVACILAGCGIGLLAGARLWGLLLLLLALSGAAWRLRPTALPADVRLLKGMAAAAALTALVIYGLFPGYLTVAAGGGPGAGLLRIEQIKLPLAGLSSQRETPVELRLTNAGLVTVPNRPGRPLRLRARLLITPERGRTRAFDEEGVALAGGLAPGRSLQVTVPIRLPHWAREGFLAWRVEDGAGRGLRLASDSDLGFRFVNRGYRALERETENRLSALAKRARDFALLTYVPEGRQRNPHGAESLIGESLDTLLFSPLWGLGAGTDEKTLPFGTPRPFWAQLFQEYGMIGVALAGAFAWGMIRRSARIAARFLRAGERIGWQLVPMTGAVVVLIGFFSPVLGTYHAVWGLFLLSGYVEGRHDYWFAQTPTLGAKPAFWPWRRQGRRQRRYKPLKRRRIHK
jgi:hypothetical protein